MPPPGLVVNNSMPPPAPPARPFVTPTPTPSPATVASPGQGHLTHLPDPAEPNDSPKPRCAFQKEGGGEGPCVRPRSSVPTSSLSSVPATNSPAAVRTSRRFPHRTPPPRFLGRRLSAPPDPQLTHKEKAGRLNRSKKEKSDTLHAARRASAPVLPPLNPSGPRSTEGRTGAPWKGS